MRPTLFAAVILIAGTALSGSSSPPWTVSLRTVGPARIGSTIAEFRRAMGSNLAPGTIARDCGYASTRDEEISFYTRNGRVAQASVYGGNARTRSGIGLGSSVDDLRRAYPGRLTDGGMGPEGQGHDYVYVPQDTADQNYRIVFTVDEGRVTALDVGTLPDILRRGESSRCFDGG